MANIFNFGIKLPLVGRTLIWELALLIILCALSMLGAFMSMDLLPSFHGVFMPGSGGTAQMMTLTLLGPIFIFIVFMTFGGIFSSYALLRKIYRRSASTKI